MVTTLTKKALLKKNKKPCKNIGNNMMQGTKWKKNNTNGTKRKQRKERREKKKRKREERKRKERKKKIRVCFNMILKQELIHGENQEFKGQVLLRMIEKLKSLTLNLAILTSNILMNYELIN